MRMPSFLASTIIAAATLLGSSAAFAGLFGFGGQINTTETSYESVVIPGDVNFSTLNGIFNVSQINGTSGITYNYGQGGYYLAGAFTGFKFDSSAAIGG